MKKLLLILLCLPMIGFGQDNSIDLNDVELRKVTTNQRNFIYKYQNFIDAVNEVIKFIGPPSNRSMLMYLLAVKNKNHYPDELKVIDLELADNEQLIELKQMFEKNFDSYIEYYRKLDEIEYLEAAQMYRVNYKINLE